MWLGVYMNVINIYPTCGMACATNLRVSCGLPNSNKSQAPTSDPPNSAFVSSGVPSSLNNADITPLSSQSRPNQILGCVKFLKIPPDHFFFSRKVPFLRIFCTRKMTCISQLQKSSRQDGRH